MCPRVGLAVTRRVEEEGSDAAARTLRATGERGRLGWQCILAPPPKWRSIRAIEPVKTPCPSPRSVQVGLGTMADPCPNHGKTAARAGSPGPAQLTCPLMSGRESWEEVGSEAGE